MHVSLIRLDSILAGPQKNGNFLKVSSHGNWIKIS